MGRRLHSFWIEKVAWACDRQLLQEAKYLTVPLGMMVREAYTLGFEYWPKSGILCSQSSCSDLTLYQGHLFEPDFKK